MQQKLNMFKSIIKLLNITGVIPSENINSSLWKSALFHIFQTLILLLFISIITLQILAIYHYWGNINLIVDCIGFFAAFVVTYFNNCYTKIFWKSICDVIDTFETNSIFCNEFVRSNQKHMKIVNETLKLAQIYIKVNFILQTIVPIFLIVPSFVQHLMTSDEEILQEVETVDGFRKYFIFVMWLPPVVKQKFIIRVMYGLQFIYAWENSLLVASLNPFYTVFYLYAGTQFKLISSIIIEMDEVMCRVENPSNILHEVTEQKFTTGTKEISDSFQSNLDTEEPTALSKERILNAKMQQNILQEVDINRQSERIHELSTAEIKSTTKNDPESFYLVECIKLHQASIE